MMQRLLDLSYHPVGICPNVFGPEPQHLEPPNAQLPVTPGVVLRLEVVAPVHLAHQLRIQTGEVDDLRTDPVLAAELHSQRLPFDQTPQQRFFSRQVPAKPAGALTADPGLPLSAHPPRVHDSVVRGNPLAACQPRRWISPPWNGSGTGEYGRRPGGGASEASQVNHRVSHAVLRTAPPRP